MDLQTLIDTCYIDTLPSKRRSVDTVKYLTHIERNLMRLYHDINDRTLQPSAYSFIVMKPKPREVFAGDVGMRICQHYIRKAIQPGLNARIIDRSFSNQKGKGAQAAVNNVISDIYELTEGYTREDCWIIKVDMKGYFPSAVQDIAYRQLEEIALDSKDAYMDDLIYLLQKSIYSYLVDHSVRKSDVSNWEFIEYTKSLYNAAAGIGGVIGWLIWQIAMIYYINEVCLWLISDCGLRITVYMDDIVIITNNKEVTLTLMPELRSRLKELNITLHPNKFYCQHWRHGLEFVGYHIKERRAYINNRCRQNGLKKIHWLNRFINENKIDYFVSVVNSYLGRYKSVCGYNLIKEIIAAIDPQWWIYLEYDTDRQCIRPKPEYTYRQRIINRFKLQKYDTKKRRNRKRNQQGSTANS